MTSCALGLQFRRIFSPIFYEVYNFNASKRNYGASPKSSEADDKKAQPSELGWVTRLLKGRKIETGTESHSNLLADKDVVFELQFHKVKPDSMDKYLDEYEGLTHMIKKWNTGGEHVGSWTVEVGDLDEAIHLWKFKGGYQTLDKHKQILRHEQEFKDFRKRRNVLLRNRINQTLLAFSFWSNINQRPGNNIYELRSYTLKPGTMIDWGNSWARGLKYRQTGEESVAGFFSHIGELYKAHHLWAYESLAAREEVRDMAWEREGWHECVAYTVPLVSSMVSRILIPTSFSPLK